MEGLVSDRGSRTYKAGLVLEQAVSDGLTELGVDHRRTPHRGHEDIEDLLDLIVSPGGGRPDLGIQLTLRPKHRTKIFAFALRSLTTVTRGIRLYVEVIGSHRRNADLVAVGRRVAEAIKAIVRRFRDFGAENLLGVRVHAITAKIEKFDIINFCGHRLLELVEAWKDDQRRLHEKRLAAQRAALRERLAAPKPLPFWHDFFHLAVDLARVCIAPTRPSPAIDLRPHFMPRRLC
ncbi:MAG: hypothetical protein AAB413_01140 [Patescibacteria group bacterium]